MAYSLNLEKLIKDLRGPKGLAALTEEVSKIKSEMDRIRDSVQPQARKRLKELQAQVNKMKTTWTKRQSQLEKEVEKTVAGLKKAAKDAETRIQKAVKGQKAGAKRKTSKKAGATKKKATRSAKKA